MNLSPAPAIGIIHGRLRVDPQHLLIPALICLCFLPFVTISEPDDWRVSRFGTASILPPQVIKAIKFLGRGGGLAIMGFSLLGIWRHPQRGQVMVVTWPLLAFGLFGVLSTAWSPLKSFTLSQSATFILVLMLATYIGTVWRGDKDTERMVQFLGLTLFTLSVCLILARIAVPSAAALTKEAAGVMHSTNAGATGGLCILLTLCARFLWNSPWARAWFVVVFIEFTMMLIAGNRLSILVTGVTSVLLIAFTMHRAAIGLALATFSLLAASYLAVDPRLELLEAGGKGIGIYAKQGQSKKELSSLSGRSEMWSKMWKSYLKSPVIGHGYFVTSPKGRIYVWYVWGNHTAHNLALQALVTMGAVGLMLLLLGFIMLAAGVNKGRKVLQDVDLSSKFLAIMAIWYFCWAFLNSSFIGPLQPEAVVFAMLVGVAAGISARGRLVCLHHRSRASAERLAGNG